ncbi:MAG: magnesium citrate secondary transporter [Cyclobacteriaceae bacterium]
MIATYSQPWFIIICCSFWLQYYLQSIGIHINLVHSYWDDLISIPIILHIIIGLFRGFHPHGKAFVFEKGHIILAVLWVSVWFEGILPLISPQYIADPIDVLMYVIGGLIYYFFLNKPIIAKH